MLRHIAMMKFKPGTTDEQVEAIATALAALPEAIPEIRSYKFARDAGLFEGNADFAVVADFDDEAGWRVYREHPAHVAVITELLSPVVAERSGIQQEI